MGCLPPINWWFWFLPSTVFRYFVTRNYRPPWDYRHNHSHRNPKENPIAVVMAQGAPRIGSVVYNPYITPIISYIYIRIYIYKCGYSIYIHIRIYNRGITIYNPFTRWDAPPSRRIVKSNQSFTQLPSLERRALSSASRPGCLSFPTPKFWASWNPMSSLAGKSQKMEVCSHVLTGKSLNPMGNCPLPRLITGGYCSLSRSIFEIGLIFESLLFLSALSLSWAWLLSFLFWSALSLSLLYHYFCSSSSSSSSSSSGSGSGSGVSRTPGRASGRAIAPFWTNPLGGGSKAMNLPYDWGNSHPAPATTSRVPSGHQGFDPESYTVS